MALCENLKRDAAAGTRRAPAAVHVTTDRHFNEDKSIMSGNIYIHSMM